VSVATRQPLPGVLPPFAPGDPVRITTRSIVECEDIPGEDPGVVYGAELGWVAGEPVSVEGEWYVPVTRVGLVPVGACKRLEGM